MTKFSSAPSLDSKETEDSIPTIEATVSQVGSSVLESFNMDKSLKQSTEVIETVGGVLSLTTPESRTYRTGEDYQFLVHVSLGNPKDRFSEIGSARKGTMMTSIINGVRQGTFEGAGGFIVRPTSPDSIKGMSEHDEAGVIFPGTTDDIEALMGDADNSEYNQVDLSFAGGEVVGIVVKISETGEELGNVKINAELRELAKTHGIPLSVVEVKPSPICNEPKAEKRSLLSGDEIKTLDIPFDDKQFIRINVAHGQFYHDDSGVTSRSTIVDQYGQYRRQLTPEQIESAIQELGKMNNRGTISDAEMVSIAEGLVLKDAKALH